MTQSLWKVVWLAKNSNINRFTKTLFRGGVEIDFESICDEYASFIDQKISKILKEVSVDENVYKDKQKVNPEDYMFMDPSSIKECLLCLKDKNNVGMNRIPQRVLLHGAELLATPLTQLFKLIYTKKRCQTNGSLPKLSQLSRTFLYDPFKFLAE
jgi:hypothetical protein